MTSLETLMMKKFIVLKYSTSITIWLWHALILITDHTSDDICPNFDEILQNDQRWHIELNDATEKFSAKTILTG